MKNKFSNSYLSISPEERGKRNLSIMLILQGFLLYLGGSGGGGDGRRGVFLTSYCSFSPLILSSIAMFSFYIISKILFLKPEGLSDAQVVSITKKEYGFLVHFL